MRLSKESDTVLIQQFIAGNDRSFEMLMMRHKEKVFTKIYIMVRDRALADDLFQDTFIKVINTMKLGKYNEEGKFLPWVMRIAHNLTIDHFRKAKKMPAVRDTDEYSIFDIIKIEEKNVEDILIENQIHTDVVKLIECLPEDQKEVLVLRLFNGLSFKDIAEKTGVSINTALGRMRYALINLRKVIEEKNIVLTK